MEFLHKIFLGPYKYLLWTLMGQQNSAGKTKIQGKSKAIMFSGFEAKLSFNIIMLPLSVIHG